MKNAIYTWFKNTIRTKRNFFLYLEFNDHQLVMALGQNAHSSLFFTSHENIALSNSEIIEGIIFNHEVLVDHINQFIKKHRLKKPLVVLNIPSLTDKPWSMHPFITLHYALFVTRLPVQLSHLIAQSFLLVSYNNSDQIKLPSNTINNTYNFLHLLTNPKQSSPVAWILTSAAFVIIMSSFCFSLVNKATYKKKTSP